VRIKSFKVHVMNADTSRSRKAISCSLIKCDSRPRKDDDVDVQTEERLLRNIEGYLMELVFVVESIDQVSLVADVLVSVKDALRDLGQKPGST
jgi:hypothetical protein